MKPTPTAAQAAASTSAISSAWSSVSSWQGPAMRREGLIVADLHPADVELAHLLTRHLFAQDRRR